MKVLDLFSGIGGFSLGLGRAGMETVAFCEIEPYCRAVLKKHWPDVPIYEDVRKLDATGLGTIDLVCGGFPCQPWSVAGKRGGTEDDRDLWPQMRRIIADVGPKWVIGENVPGLDDERFMGLDRVLSDLEGLGYQATTLEIPACAVDAPHRRSRLWIVAHSRQFVSDVSGINSGGEGEEEPSGSSSKQNGVINCVVRHVFKRTPGDWWRTQSRMDRSSDGVPNRVDRLKGLGNAVVPQVVEQIGRAIIVASA